jgi:uncharacterized protein (DUF305 family)
MKVNYKILAIVLAVIIFVSHIWYWRQIFSYNININHNGKDSHFTNNKHQMQNHDMSEDMMEMDMNDMIQMMEGKTGKDLEREFILGMIPHHQGAVNMAKRLLADPSVNPQLKDFANKVITAQESEIKMMEQWLNNY